MDVDGDVYKYDEYVRGAPREVITVETRIKPTNKGFAMLAKLGWTEGQPLGISGDGRVDPIPFQIKRDSTGLGKTSQDVRMIETTVSQRRGLDSERLLKETEDQRRAREELVARKSALETEISSTLKAFYCSLCDKQFKNVAQYDEHTNSYAHHHKARFKDMQANVRLKDKDEIDKRKEKERKREEKALRKIAAANGIKMAKPAATVADTASAMDVDSPAPTANKGGWATVSGTGGRAPATGGWASVGSNSAPREASTSSHSVPAAPLCATPPPTKHTSAPAFRAAGWTSLDTGSSQVVSPASPGNAPPPPPPVNAPPPPPVNEPPPPPPDNAPPPPPAPGRWSSIPSSSSNLPPPQPSASVSPLPPGSGWSQNSWSSNPPPPPPQPVQGDWARYSSNPPPPQPLGAGPGLQAPGPPQGGWSGASSGRGRAPSTVPPPPENPPPSIPVRSGWQQFQKSGAKRR
ncbi:hypothetical protein DXG03_006119 [Asterophora parasitica]|uniref:G-patch domain-containing protein n=1 Tax=Asterophora parasitica TaxID=117018 RepID=A0A9P7KGU7_9AGAR|nr:hypothetical protein DXG03_006119 [Asterophora parasitica]